MYFFILKEYSGCSLYEYQNTFSLNKLSANWIVALNILYARPMAGKKFITTTDTIRLQSI